MHRLRPKRIECIVVLAAAFGIVFVSGHSLWAGEATFSKEDLLVLAEKQQSLIQDIQATVDYNCVKIEGNAEGIWRRNRLTFKIKGEKQYILSEGARDLEAKEFESREEKAYDGKISTLLFTGGDLANIREGKAGDIIGAYYPILSMAMMQGVVKGERYYPDTDLPTLLRAKGSVVRKETERIDGRDCHVVDSLYNGKPLSTVWLDVERGCMPLLQRRYGRDGSLRRETKTTKLWNFGDGLWLPVAGRSILVFPDNRSEYVINALDPTTGKPRVKVNSGIKDEEFKVKIPPGTEVIDTYAGIAYSQPALRPEELIKPMPITEETQETEPPPEQAPEKTGESHSPQKSAPTPGPAVTGQKLQSKLFLLIGIVIIAAAILAIVVRRRKGASKGRSGG